MHLLHKLWTYNLNINQSILINQHKYQSNHDIIIYICNHHKEHKNMNLHVLTSWDSSNQHHT